MPFIARRFLTDSVEDCIKPEDLAPYEKRNSFFCPGCSCEFLYRSESSNDKAAHFYRHGKHEPDCWMPNAESISGNVEWETTEGFNIDRFFASITSAKNRSGNGPGTSGGGTAGTAKKHLSTLRNLYKFCCFHDNESVIYDKVAVKDILVARKTAYLYTSYVKGIHLIEAHYWRYNSNTHTLFFYYPYSANDANAARFKVAVECPEEIFYSLRDQVYGSDRIILLMCDWTFANNYIHGKLINKHQLIVL